MSEFAKLFTRDAIAVFRLVAQRKQRFAASGRRAGARNGQHFFLVQIGTRAAPRWMGKRAVVTTVAAQLRQRNENFSRIGNHAAVVAVAQCGRDLHQCGKVSFVIRQREDFRVRQTAAVPAAGQGAIKAVHCEASAMEAS